MENAINPVTPNNSTPDPVLARHVATATVNMLKALHFERFFGQPIAGFSPAHNAARAEANDRTVRAYAREAGQYAFYAGETLARWTHDYPAAMNVARIRESMLEGWLATAKVLTVDVTATVISA